MNNKAKKKLNVASNFQDIDSLNVSKIVTEDNDLDFVRNELWFTFKQKQILNPACFYKLKKIFEEKNKISELEVASVDLNDLTTIQLIEIIISESNSKNEIAKAFFLLEKQIQ